MRKVKLSLCLTIQAPRHDDVSDSGDIALPFLTSPPDWGERSALRPGRFTPGERVAVPTSPLSWNRTKEAYRRMGSCEEQAERLQTKWIPHKPNPYNGVRPEKLMPCLLGNSKVEYRLHMSQLSPVQAFGAYLKGCIFSLLSLFWTLTSPTSIGRSVGIVRLRTTGTEFLILKK
jgi:hypothetical protein